MSENLDRCDWCLKYPLYIDYHDNEWGVAEHDEIKLFEMINLEGAQAGLNWYTVLQKRENYRMAFDGFIPEIIASYNQDKIDRLLQNAGIIRNKLKINSFINNARVFLEMKSNGQSFSDYVWSFVDFQPKINSFTSLSEVPATSPESEAMSKSMKKLGFKFVGSTICYAFMQACGMVDDHVEYCYKRKQ
jgi:DNA-3-methyladenine glycosylase I